MANRVAGIAFVKVDGRFLPLRGNFTVSPTPVERTGIAGQDGVHGFSELPRVPYIEGDITLDPGVETETLESALNVTVTAELANGHTYVLSQAWCKGALDLNTHDGMTRVRWEGVRCVELAGFTTTTSGVTFSGPGAP